MIKIALVGRGAVGSSIKEYLTRRIMFDNDFDAELRQYHSKNISDAYGTKPDVLIYAGVPAKKWLANKEPKKDEQIIEQAFENIKLIDAKKIYLISTVDAHTNDNNNKYGVNRLTLENKVTLYSTLNDKDLEIIALPALWGHNISKNFFNDLLNPAPFSGIQEQAAETINKILKHNHVKATVSINDELEVVDYEPTFATFYLNGWGLPLITNRNSKFVVFDLDEPDNWDFVFSQNEAKQNFRMDDDRELYFYQPYNYVATAGQVFKNLYGNDMLDNDDFTKLIDYATMLSDSRNKFVEI